MALVYQFMKQSVNNNVHKQFVITVTLHIVVDINYF